MDFLEDTLPLDLPLANSSIIKVIGVGGGGGNAVNHMYKQLSLIHISEPTRPY
jgi:cell division protein FtsZ